MHIAIVRQIQENSPFSLFDSALGWWFDQFLSIALQGFEALPDALKGPVY